MAKKNKTTEKIKKAAHDLFLQKGFASTSIREIAENAGTNVALLNYHFGSKKNLYEVVLQEKIQQLMQKIVPIVFNEETSIETKIDDMVDAYIDFLQENPDLLTFVFNEVRKNNFDFIKESGLGDIIHQSYFLKQLSEASQLKNPFQILMSLVSMVVFPFMAQPFLIQSKVLDHDKFLEMMIERKKLIPLWIKSMLKTSEL